MDQAPTQIAAPASAPQMSPLWKLALEFGPLLCFFVAYVFGDIFWATGAAIAASLFSVAVYWLKLRRVPAAVLITFFVVGVLGGITLLLQDPDFVKMKPTAVYLLFAGALLGGLWKGKILLSKIMGEALALTPEGWRSLTLHWGVFFLAMAAANEIVWRGFPEHVWVNFKVWAIPPITLAFGILELVLHRRHLIETAETPKKDL